MDFAFFVVNLGLSVDDAKSLTKREQLFLMKAYENKVVFETGLINKAVANAIYNVIRKKGQKYRPLWQRRPKQTETETMKVAVQEIKKETDKSWVEKIYASNGKLQELKRLMKKKGS